jgi:hypothetical protein
MPAVSKVIKKLDKFEVISLSYLLRKVVASLVDVFLNLGCSEMH